MLKKIRFLKFCFLAGAIMDGLALLPMLFPQIREMIFGTAGPGFGPEYRYAITLTAALMAGWTGLMIWGYLKPIERRGILLITAFPAITGLLIANMYGISTGIIPLRKMFPTIGIEIVLMFLFISGFKLGQDAARNTG